MAEFEVGLYGQRGFNPTGVTKVTVEAADSHRAKQVAESIYGGKANMGVSPVSNHQRDKIQLSSSSSSSSGGSGSSMDLETTTGLVVIGGGLLAFFMFMPWVLMGAGGAAGAWLGEKLTGFNVTETELDTKNDEHMKKFGTILALSLLLGGIGFTTGHNFTNSSSSVDTVEEVRN